MDDTSTDRLERELHALKGLRNDGQLSENQYHTRLVCLAYEYIKAEDSSGALQVLRLIPGRYYREVMAQQIVEDRAYAHSASAVSRYLVLHGLVDSEDTTPNVFPNIKVTA